MPPAPRRDGARGPARLWIWLAGLGLPGDEREFARGDLAEEFDERTARHGRADAARWLRREALRSLLYRSPAAHHAPEPRSTGGLMTAFRRDVLFAIRLLGRTPLISAAAVLTLALGIGANTAIFSVAWPVLGARLAFPDEDRLAFILLSIERNGQAGSNPISAGDYFDLLDARSFGSLAGFNMFVNESNLSLGETEPEQVRIARVTEEFFRVLGVQALVGRTLQASDYVDGPPPLVLEERLWRRTFGADPDVVGRSVTIDGEPWRIVGVVPNSTEVGTVDADAWSTQRLDRATARQLRSYYLAMIGRLRPGVTLEDANRELRALMLRVADRYPVSNRMPDGAPVLARAQSFRERLTGPVRPVFLLLTGGAGLVLLIAGINLAGLHLARNLARRQELSVRRALGAARGTLARQLLVENLVLAGLGGLVGLLAASFTLAALAEYAPKVAWYQISPRLTLPVALFALGLTAVAGLAIGAVPALTATGSRQTSLQTARGGTSDRRTARTRTVILGAQIAMTIVLLVAATLTAASLWRVLGVDPGFTFERGLIADVRPTGSQGENIQFFQTLVERAEALPGVERACAINHIPLANDGGGMTFVPEGRTDADMQGALPMGVTAGCFETLRIPLVSGRTFLATEAESVAIVNESMARRLWPDGSDPVGRRIHIGLVSGPLFTVVGVVKDIRAASLESSFTRQVWMSASRGWPMPQRLILRTSVPPGTLARPLRSILRELDPNLALGNVRTMQDVVGEATASRRFVLWLLGGFAVIALALSMVGIYGLLAHQVGQRTREIGIRVALGSPRRAVIGTVTRPIALGLAGGLIAGLVGARLLSSLIATQLFQMSATDVRVYAGVAAFVTGVALLACWPPTRRATRISPVVAMRE
jgi:predicted permease